MILRCCFVRLCEKLSVYAERFTFGSFRSYSGVVDYLL